MRVRHRFNEFSIHYDRSLVLSSFEAHLMKGKAGEAAREWRGAEVLSCTTCIADIDFRRSVVVVRPLSFCFDHT